MKIKQIAVLNNPVASAETTKIQGMLFALTEDGKIYWSNIVDEERERWSEYDTDKVTKAETPEEDEDDEGYF